MKLNDVKKQVFDLTCTQTTKQLKRQRPDLTHNADLRYKLHWLKILEKIKELRTTDDELSLLDLDQSEIMLKESLFKVGRMANIQDESIELDWQRIKLNSLISNIHIEEL